MSTNGSAAASTATLASLENKIKELGDFVRTLKLAKADKVSWRVSGYLEEVFKKNGENRLLHLFFFQAQIDVEVAKLLAAKEQYKAMGGTDLAPAAPARSKDAKKKADDKKPDDAKAADTADGKKKKETKYGICSRFET